VAAPVLQPRVSRPKHTGHTPHFPFFLRVGKALASFASLHISRSPSLHLALNIARCLLVQGTGITPFRATLRPDMGGTAMPSRRLLLAAAALLPFSAEAHKRKRRRCKRRPPAAPCGCQFGPVGAAPWACGPPDLACACVDGPDGAVCVRRPVGEAPSCVDGLCRGICAHASDHPTHLRCYEPCLSHAPTPVTKSP
jgi:hypothetical protein